MRKSRSFVGRKRRVFVCWQETWVPPAVLEILVYQKPDSGADNYLQGRQGPKVGRHGQ